MGNLSGEAATDENHVVADTQRLIFLLEAIFAQRFHAIPML
jgi:hypothetical protein